MNLAAVCARCDVSGRRCAACNGLTGKAWSWVGDDKDRAFCPACAKGARCDTCSAPVAASTVPIADGRRFCRPCSTAGVFDARRLWPLAEEAREWMRSALAMPLENFSRCELVLVDRRAFGVPGFFDKLMGAVPSPRAGDFSCSVMTQGRTRTLERVRVRVLSGHSDSATRLILAHELTHLWQAEQALRDDTVLREGHAVWVEHQLATRRGETGLARRLEASTDPVYGGGFRTVRAMLSPFPPHQAACVMARRLA